PRRSPSLRPASSLASFSSVGSRPQHTARARLHHPSRNPRRRETEASLRRYHSSEVAPYHALRRSNQTMEMAQYLGRAVARLRARGLGDVSRYSLHVIKERACASAIDLAFGGKVCRTDL